MCVRLLEMVKGIQRKILGPCHLLMPAHQIDKPCLIGYKTTLLPFRIFNCIRVAGTFAYVYTHFHNL